MQTSLRKDPGRSCRYAQQKSSRKDHWKGNRKGHQEKRDETKKPKLPKHQGPEEELREGLREIAGLQGRAWKRRRRRSTMDLRGRPR